MRVTHAGLHLCRTGTFKMQDVFDMVYSLLVFVNIRIILYKTYVVLICGKYNTLTLEFKINIAIRVPLQSIFPPSLKTVTFIFGDKRLFDFQPQIEQPPVKIIKDPQSEVTAEPSHNVLTQLLKYSFKYASCVQHDFTKSR